MVFADEGVHRCVVGLLSESDHRKSLIPWLYLKGISMGESLQALLGQDAEGFSPNVVVRLKARWGHEYEEWSPRETIFVRRVE